MTSSIDSSRSAGTSDASEPRIVGRYALFDEIASGGMATIHLGRLVGSAGFARTVAIKTLHPQFARDPEFVEMFLQEAKLASRIQHPNVISTLDRIVDQGEAFLVMEYVAGESLAKLVRASLKQGRQVPHNVAVSILAGTLHGLHATHEAMNENREPMHIVHRDVSPQNILVGLDGVARIFDFGVAKAAAMKSQATADGQMKGKLSYMSPEQLNSKSVDRRTDVFAAGVVAWECVSGRRLFSGSDPGEVLAKVLTLDIASPRESQPDIPEGLSNAIMKALERDANKRWSTAREFAIALENTGLNAPNHVVGAWVEQHASEALTDRRSRVESVERASMELEALPVDSLQTSSVAPPRSVQAHGSAAVATQQANSEPTAAYRGPVATQAQSTRGQRDAYPEGTATAAAANISIDARPESGGRRQVWGLLLVGGLAITSIVAALLYNEPANGGEGHKVRAVQRRSRPTSATPGQRALPTSDLYRAEQLGSRGAPPAQGSESEAPPNGQLGDEGATSPPKEPSPPPVLNPADLPEHAPAPERPPAAASDQTAKEPEPELKRDKPVSKPRRSTRNRSGRRSAKPRRRGSTKPSPPRQDPETPAAASPDVDNNRPSGDSAANCQPPTYVDEEGIVRVKTQCL